MNGRCAVSKSEKALALNLLELILMHCKWSVETVERWRRVALPTACWLWRCGRCDLSLSAVPHTPPWSRSQHRIWNGRKRRKAENWKSFLLRYFQNLNYWKSHHVISRLKKCFPLWCKCNILLLTFAFNFLVKAFFGGKRKEHELWYTLWMSFYPFMIRLSTSKSFLISFYVKFQTICGGRGNSILYYLMLSNSMTRKLMSYQID